MAKLRLSTQAGDVEEYLASLKASPRFGPQVVHHESIAAVSPAFGEPAKEFAPELDARNNSMKNLITSSDCNKLSFEKERWGLDYFYVPDKALNDKGYQNGFLEADCDFISQVYSSDYARIFEFN